MSLLNMRGKILWLSPPPDLRDTSMRNAIPSKALVLGALLLPLLALPVRADDPMPRKDGLWEGTMMGKTMVMCVDAASEAAAYAKAKAMLAGMCSKRELHRTANGYVQDSVCDMMGSKQTSHQVTEFKGDSEYTAVTTMHYDPPFMGKTDDTLTQTAKWRGPCGADMKPGDVSINGRTVKAPMM
jgi:hypothetical protein